MVTLLALTLVIGILVDDAIVEIENIEKRVDRGERPYEAALEGADAIGLAVVATTMTIVVVFMPVQLHAGHPRPVLQGVRPHGLGGGAVLAAGGAPADAADGRLLPEALDHAPRAQAVRRASIATRWSGRWRTGSSPRSWAASCSSARCSWCRCCRRGSSRRGDPDFIYVDIQGPPGATVSDMETTAAPSERAVPRSAGGEGRLHPDRLHGVQLRSGHVRRRRRRPAQGHRHDPAEERPRRPPATRSAAGCARNCARSRTSGWASSTGEGGAGFQQILTGDNAANLEPAARELELQMRTPAADRRSEGVQSAASGRRWSSAQARPRPRGWACPPTPSPISSASPRSATSTPMWPSSTRASAASRSACACRRAPAPTSSASARCGCRSAGGGTTTLGSVADIAFQAGPARIDRLNRERRMTVQAELERRPAGRGAEGGERPADHEEAAARRAQGRDRHVSRPWPSCSAAS